jgi:hypothetical protein
VTQANPGPEGPKGPAGDVEVQIIQAREVSVPVSAVRTGPSPSFSSELLKLRSDFLAGETLSAEDLTRVMVATAEDTAPTNGNCNLC